jgi:hypothetical protein
MKTGLKLSFLIIPCIFIGLVYVQAQILSENEWGAVVLEVESPENVEIGGLIAVNVTVEYNFPVGIEIITGIWDHSVQNFIERYNETVSGHDTIEYEFILRFREDLEVGTYTFDANVLMKFGDEVEHLEENWMKSFEVEVIEPKSQGFKIPGYPAEAVIVGIACSILLIRFRFGRG